MCVAWYSLVPRLSPRANEKSFPYCKWRNTGRGLGMKLAWYILSACQCWLIAIRWHRTIFTYLVMEGSKLQLDPGKPYGRLSTKHFPPSWTSKLLSHYLFITFLVLNSSCYKYIYALIWIHEWKTEHKLCNTWSKLPLTLSFAQELIQYIFNCRKFQKGFSYCTNTSGSQRWKLATLLPLLPKYHYTGTLSLSSSSMTAPFPTRNSTTFVRPRLAALCRGVNWWKTKTQLSLQILQD